jgi:hypothetical protein
LALPESSHSRQVAVVSMMMAHFAAITTLSARDDRSHARNETLPSRDMIHRPLPSGLCSAHFQPAGGGRSPQTSALSCRPAPSPPPVMIPLWWDYPSSRALCHDRSQYSLPEWHVCVRGADCWIAAVSAGGCPLTTPGGEAVRLARYFFHCFRRLPMRFQVLIDGVRRTQRYGGSRSIQAGTVNMSFPDPFHDPTHSPLRRWASPSPEGMDSLPKKRRRRPHVVASIPAGCTVTISSSILRWNPGIATINGKILTTALDIAPKTAISRQVLRTGGIMALDTRTSGGKPLPL